LDTFAGTVSGWQARHFSLARPQKATLSGNRKTVLASMQMSNPVLTLGLSDDKLLTLYCVHLILLSDNHFQANQNK